MNLSKLNRKYKDCLGPSSIAQSLTDNSCYRQLWLQYRFKSESQDSIFLERYKLQHASSLNILKNHLSSKNPDSNIDTEVQLPVVEFHGVKLFGIADIILTKPDGRVGIYDAKTGSRKAFHWMQTALYFLMQKAAIRSQGLEMPKLFGLGLFYCDGKEQSDSICEKSLLELEGDDALNKIFLPGTKSKLKEALLITSNNELPKPQASLNNCRFCKFRNECDAAIKDEGVITGDDLI